jgi:hypothetical protein
VDSRGGRQQEAPAGSESEVRVDCAGRLGVAHRARRDLGRGEGAPGPASSGGWGAHQARPVEARCSSNRTTTALSVLRAPHLRAVRLAIHDQEPAVICVLELGQRQGVTGCSCDAISSLVLLVAASRKCDSAVERCTVQLQTGRDPETLDRRH